MLGFMPADSPSYQANRCRLLAKLPAELRLVIYEMVLKSTRIISWEWNTRTWRRYFLEQPEFLHVYPQIMTEALPIYERILHAEQVSYEEEADRERAKFTAHHWWHGPGSCPHSNGMCIWLDAKAQRAETGADEVKRLVRREVAYWRGIRDRLFWR